MCRSNPLHARSGACVQGGEEGHLVQEQMEPEGEGKRKAPRKKAGKGVKAPVEAAVPEAPAGDVAAPEAPAEEPRIEPDSLLSLSKVLPSFASSPALLRCAS